MSTKNNDQGRAFEYACLMGLEKEISKIRPCRIVQNSSLAAARKSWETLSDSDKNIYTLSSIAAIRKILMMEPIIIEKSKDVLELLIQPDSKGTEGDVRDIIIFRQSITWEICLSVKHNNFAVKHSRLSPTIDFGKLWYGIPCTQTYWNDINPVFNLLSDAKNSGLLFSDIDDKASTIYRPILNAFAKELKSQASMHPSIARKLVEYLLGNFDFYKVISVDYDKYTQIQGFNMHGTLNQRAGATKPTIKVPVIHLPSRIVCIEFAKDSDNTIEVYMDAGWQFSFRIHNGAKHAEPSLKLDIQILGMPTNALF